MPCPFFKIISIADGRKVKKTTLQVTILKKIISSSGNCIRNCSWTGSVFSVTKSTWTSLDLLRTHQLFQNFEMKSARAAWLPGAGVWGLCQEGAQWLLDFLYFHSSEGSWVPCPTPGLEGGSGCTLGSPWAVTSRCRNTFPASSTSGCCTEKRGLWCLRGFWFRL